MRWVSWSFQGLISFKNHLSHVTQQRPLPEHLFLFSYSSSPRSRWRPLLFPVTQGIIPDSVCWKWAFLYGKAETSYAWRSWAVFLSKIQWSQFLSLLQPDTKPSWTGGSLLFIFIMFCAVARKVRYSKSQIPPWRWTTAQISTTEKGVRVKFSIAQQINGGKLRLWRIRKPGMYVCMVFHKICWDLLLSKMNQEVQELGKMTQHKFFRSISGIQFSNFSKVWSIMSDNTISKRTYAADYFPFWHLPWKIPLNAYPFFYMPLKIGSRYHL